MNIKKYISELKRRNVFKASIAYLIVAWLITQVASIILPTFGAPPYLMKVLIFILIIGFPINLIFAWVYEITPEGIKKTKNADQSKPKSAQTNSRLNKVIIASLSIAVIFLLFNQFWNTPTTKVENIDLSKKIISSIAVLPFQNTKSDPETDYLGFALADQIIGDLVYLKEIMVRPSGSIRKYEKQAIDPIIVGNELQVGYVLIGSYLMVANVIRLTVELINANNNEIIWREPIEVDFKNAFELQDIVAQKVVEGLNIQFTKKDSSRIGKDIPQNPLAYEYYLRSLSYPRSTEGNKLAIDMLEKSLELDSNYAPIYNQLGHRIHSLAAYGVFNSSELNKAEKLFEKAISLNMELISALANLSGLYTETGRIEKAVELIRQTLKINPNNADALFSMGYIYRYAGMDNEAILEMQKAILIDPKNIRYNSFSLSYYNLGEYKKALDLIEFTESSDWIIGIKGFILFKQKKYKQALVIYNQIIDKEPEGFWGLLSTAYKAKIQGDIPKGLEAMQKLEKKGIIDPEPAYYNAAEYAMLGDKEASIRSLQRAVDAGYFNYPAMLTNSFLDSMRDEPEFQKIIEKAKKKHLAFKKRFF